MIKSGCQNHVTLDVSYLPNYKQLTSNDFYFVVTAASSFGPNSFTLNPRISYTASTGILYINGYGHHEYETGRADAGIGLTYDVYLK